MIIITQRGAAHKYFVLLYTLKASMDRSTWFMVSRVEGTVSWSGWRLLVKACHHRFGLIFGWRWGRGVGQMPRRIVWHWACVVSC
jgi:hypothetical protein